MDGYEFERRLLRLGREKGFDVRFVNHGKGSHGRLYIGSNFTTIKNRRKEIGKGLLHAMCKQLKVDPAEI